MFAREYKGGNSGDERPTIQGQGEDYCAGTVAGSTRATSESEQ